MTDFTKLAKYRLCYLATPYSNFKHGIHVAHMEACRFAGGLIAHGVKVYSPIAHTHPIAMFAHMDPYDHKLWLDFDQAMMDACDALIVAKLLGWEDSKGVDHEIKTFGKANKPIHFLEGDLFA